MYINLEIRKKGLWLNIPASSSRKLVSKTMDSNWTYPLRKGCLVVGQVFIRWTLRFTKHFQGTASDPGGHLSTDLQYPRWKIPGPQPQTSTDFHASVMPAWNAFDPSPSSPLDLSNLLIFQGPNQMAAKLTLLQQYLPTFFTPWHSENTIFVWHTRIEGQSCL